MNDIEQARKKWLAERPNYEDFGKLLEQRLRNAVQAKGVWCETESRAKEPHSLIKKLLKGEHSYESLPDKVGVRCIVRFLSEVEMVVLAAQELFACSQADRKIEELGADRVGYLSVHVEVRLRPSDPQVENYPPNQFWAELQLRTLAQHLWAEMTHDSVYKSDEALARLPPDIRRRVSLMAGVIEVADREFERLNQELTLTPEVQLYKLLERHYYKFATKRPDVELSLEVIALLAPLYGSDVPTIKSILEKFVNDREALLHAVYAEATEAGVTAFLYQPEVLMIYERLETDQLATRRVWNKRFPETELEHVANTFGISFD